MEVEPGEPGNAEVPATMAPQVEEALHSAWRRILAEDSRPRLTPSEAAHLLGVSIETMQRRIRDGQIQTSSDDRGRIRISASVTYTPEGAVTEDTTDAESMARLSAELKAVRDELHTARAQEARLEEELEAAEMALQYTKTELSNLWRVMTTRNLKQAARNAVQDSHEGPKVISLAEQRLRIRTKVNDVREIARRRKWPWSLVG